MCWMPGTCFMPKDRWKVRPGLAALLAERRNLLSGRRVGLVSHSAAVLPDLSGIVDGLLASGVNLRALFGAEHGFTGAALDGEQVGSASDPRSGLPLYSLYGATLEPQPAMLDGLDVLVVDFQDAGARFYTFLSTLYYVLRAAGRVGLPVVVLDRPNPINGLSIEGPRIEPGFESFVGITSIPIRHGLTFGELALWLSRERHLDAPLTVVPMQGWQRGMWFDQTGLPWVLPSPAMPRLSTATVYPGMCLVEGTNLSEGRGTALPFEVVGAPWLDGHRLAERLNRLELPGVRFRPHTFSPAASKFAGQVCAGVQVHVTDRDIFEPVRCGLHVIAACRAMGGERFTFLPGDPPHFDLLAGSAELRAHLLAGGAVDEVVGAWREENKHFVAQREACLLYR